MKKLLAECLLDTFSTLGGETKSSAHSLRQHKCLARGWTPRHTLNVLVCSCKC